MIIDFSVENFGPFKERQSISFEARSNDGLEDYYFIEPIPGVKLLKLILIYGANASGKTTLLEAIDFLRELILNPADKKNEDLMFLPFMFDNSSRNKDSYIELSFIEDYTKYLYRISFNRTYISKEELFIYNPKKSLVFSRTTDPERQISDIKFGNKLKVSKSATSSLINNTLLNNTVFGGFLKTNINVPEVSTAFHWFAQTLTSIISPSTDIEKMVNENILNGKIKKERITEILKKADLNVKDIEISENEIEFPPAVIEFMEKTATTEEAKKKLDKIKGDGKLKTTNVEFIHSIKGETFNLPFRFQSHGSKRFYSLAGALDLLLSSPTVIPIDELETSLHPDLFIHFILMHLANTKSSQLIATTHNKEILKNKDLFRRDAIWFTDKTESGNTILYSLNDFDTKTIRDTSSVYNAYSIGKLGGVPDLNDYFLETDIYEKSR